ncbi:MAG: hypothetical protein JW768_06735 [Chitinispirillaceae bacterium]|nr:hypothetical protein [Chitinispirillaceae bacterium]
MAMDHPPQWLKPSHRPTVWVLFLLFAVAETVIVKHIASLSVLDARLAYEPAQALALVEALDASALSTYRLFNVVDFVFIVVYSVLLVTWFRLLDPDVDTKLRGWPWLGLLPGVFDFVETTGVAFLLHSEQPGQSPGLWLAVLGTPLKWFGAVLALSLLVVAEVRGLRRRRLQGRPWYDLSAAPREGLFGESEQLPPDGGGP